MSRTVASLFQILNLGFNEIGPEGGLAIVAALDNKPNIKVVQLNGNQVSKCCRLWLVVPMFRMNTEVDKISRIILVVSKFTH